MPNQATASFLDCGLASNWTSSWSRAVIRLSKNEVIALSEEFHIMTPYTSLLVLETDADRKRFGVKRRFQMRDGERFFAEGRSKASFELLQKQMQAAGNWRLQLRQQVLRELASLGRVRMADRRGGAVYSDSRSAGYQMQDNQPMSYFFSGNAEAAAEPMMATGGGFFGQQLAEKMVEARMWNGQSDATVFLSDGEEQLSERFDALIADEFESDASWLAIGDRLPAFELETSLGKGSADSFHWTVHLNPYPVLASPTIGYQRPNNNRSSLQMAKHF